MVESLRGKLDFLRSRRLESLMGGKDKAQGDTDPAESVAAADAAASMAEEASKEPAGPDDEGSYPPSDPESQGSA